MKRCTEWNDIEGISARCPYCFSIIEVSGIHAEDDEVDCQECGNRFQLGDQA